MTKKREIGKQINDDIRLSFDLLKSKNSTYRWEDINLSKSIIVSHFLDDISCYDKVIGINVFSCDLQTPFDYFIAIKNPSEIEKKFLICHRELMENR